MLYGSLRAIIPLLFIIGRNESTRNMYQIPTIPQTENHDIACYYYLCALTEVTAPEGPNEMCSRVEM